jgi:hypothetical protein
VLSRIFIFFSLSFLFSVENFQQKRTSTIIMTKTELRDIYRLQCRPQSRRW